MKKLLAILLAMTMLLCACGAQPSDTAQSTSQADEDVQSAVVQEAAASEADTDTAAPEAETEAAAPAASEAGDKLCL